MEIVVSILVGLVGAAATILAAYIQANRTNLYTATEMKSLNHEVRVSLEEPGRGIDVNVRREEESESGKTLTLQARIAFLQDLGCDPDEGELLLFHRQARFKLPDLLPGHGWYDGWVIVTNRRVICRRYERIFTTPSIRDSRGMFDAVVLSGGEIKASRVRIQDGVSVLIEAANVRQLFIMVKTGFFEPKKAVASKLLAIICSIAQK